CTGGVRGSAARPLSAAWEPQGAELPVLLAHLLQLIHEGPLDLRAAFAAQRDARNHQATAWIVAVAGADVLDVKPLTTERQDALPACLAALLGQNNHTRLDTLPARPDAPPRT